MEVKWVIKKDLRILLVVDGASSRTDEVKRVSTHDQNENEDQRQRHDPAKQNQEQDPADEEQDGHDGAGFVRLVPVAGGVRMTSPSNSSLTQLEQSKTR